MANEQDAILRVRMEISTADLRAELSKAKTELKEINALVKSGAITPTTARTRIVSLGSRAQALQESLARGGASPAKLGELTKFIDRGAKAYASLEADAKKVTRATNEYVTKIQGAAARLLNAALGSERAAKKTQSQESKAVDRTKTKIASNEKLLADPKLLTDEADSARRLKNAKDASALAARTKYQNAIVANEVEQAKIGAQENRILYQALEADEEYLSDAARAAAAKKRQAAALNASVQQELAGGGGAAGRLLSGKYISDLASANAARARINIQRDLLTEGDLAGDPSYATSKGQLAALRQKATLREQTVTETLLAADSDLARQTGELSALRRRRLIAEQQAFLTASRGDIEAEARLAAAQTARKAQVGAAGVDLRREDPFFAAQARQTVQDQAALQAQRTRDDLRRNLLSQRSLAGDPLLARQSGELAALRHQAQTREALVTEQLLAADKSLATTTATLAALRRRREIQEAEALLTATRGDVGAEARLAAGQELRRSEVGAERVRQIDTDPIAALQHTATLNNEAAVQAQSIRDDATKRAAIQKELAVGEASLIEDLAQTKVAEERRRLAVNEQVRAKLGVAGLDAIARDEVAQSTQTEIRRQKVIALTLAEEEGLLALKAQSAIQAKVLAQAEHRLTQETLKEAIARGDIARGSVVQRIQAGVAARARGSGSVRLPTDFATGPQLLRGSLVTSARFAASGALLYGGIAGIAKAVKEAEELEKIFNQIRRQFESLGQVEAFPQFRQEILAIARETGSAGAEVASVGFQLQGAFGGDTSRALRETEDAFKAVRVTGLSITEVIDAFTALTQSFDDAGVTIENVSDKALGLQERFGVLAKETISFAADLAPVAAQAGFTVEQLEALGAVSQKYSGRSGASLAEAFGRILPSIQSNAVQFLELFEQLGDSGISSQVAEAFRTGNIAEFFEILLRSYSDLSGAQKNYVIELLGGRREAAALIPVLENSGELLNEFARGQEDAGKTSQYFGDLQQTLGQQVAQFGERLSQVGVQLYDSGLKDFLEDTIQLASLFVDAFSGVVSILSSVGNALGAIPGVGGSLTSILNAVLLYKGVGALAGTAIGGRALAAAGLGRFAAGRAATAAAPAVLTSGGTPLLTTGFGAAAGGTAATAAASRLGLLGRFKAGYTAAEGASLTAGIAGGIKGAVSTFNWVGLGITAGTLIAQELSSGIEQASRNRINKLIGEDGRIQDLNDDGSKELRNITGEFGPKIGTFDDLESLNVDIPTDIFASDAEKINRTVAQLRKDFIEQARDDASGFQRAVDNLPLGDHSGDVNDNVNAAAATYDENQARIQEFFTEVANNQELQFEIARRQLEGQVGEGNEQAIGERVTRNRASLNRLIAAMESGDASAHDVQVLKDFLTSEIPRAEQAIQERAAQLAEDQALEGKALLDAEEAINLYRSGEIGSAEARQALTQRVRSLTTLGYDEGTADQRVAYAKALKESKEFQSEVLLTEAKTQADVAEQFGGGQPTQRLDTFVNLLRTGRLTPKDSAEAAQLAIDSLQAVFDATLATKETAAEQAKLFAEGIPVPQEVQTQQIYAYLQNGSVAYQEFIFTATGGMTEVANAITLTAADLIAKGASSWTQAVKEAMALQIQVIVGLKQRAIEAIYGAAIVAGAQIPSGDLDFSGYDKQIADLYNNISKVPTIEGPDFSTFGRDPDQEAKLRRQKEKEEEDKRRAIALARLDVQKALNEGDALAIANIDIQIAQTEAAFAKEEGDVEGQLRAQAALIRAQNARRQALSANRLARHDLSLASRGDDPVGAAYNQIVEAGEALALARGAAARLAAQAARVRAQRALAEAFQDIGIAQLELAQAMANAAGDSVEAAEIALRIARDQLANIKRNSPNDKAAILQAQADVVGQEAALRDADLNERQRAIDVALQLEQITVGQAIAQLQALLTLPKLTKEQMDNILLKIKSLKDSLSSDFRFNLPSDINIPTAYEVRRFDQTPTGTGYTDNRVITVEVTAETNADPEQIATAVVQAVGQPNRQGTQPRRY